MRWRSAAYGCQVGSVTGMGGQQRFGTGRATSWPGRKVGSELWFVVQGFVKAGIEAAAIYFS